MAHINTPAPFKDKVTSLVSFLGIESDWQKAQASSSGNQDGFLSQLWYRGVDRQFPDQVPGVYRNDFTARAGELTSHKGNIEDQRLHLEREMLSQFRTAGATFLNRNTPVEIYFTAQHFGMSTPAENSPLYRLKIPDP